MTAHLFKTKTMQALLVCNLFAANAAFAEDTNTPLGFQGSGEFGFSNTSGNTDNQTLYGRLALNYLQTGYEAKSSLEANNHKENNLTTEERYLVDTQANIFMNTARTTYLLAGLRLEQNKFASIDMSTTFSIGAGKKFYSTPTTSFAAEAGIGNQQIDFVNGTTLEQTIMRVKLDFAHKFNDHVKVLQDAMALGGQTNTLYETNTALKVKMSDAMSLSVGYKMKHNSQPAAGKVKTDTQTLMTLVYDF